MNKRLIIYTVLWFGALQLTAHAATVVWPAASLRHTGDNLYVIRSDLVSETGGIISVGFEATTSFTSMTLAAWIVTAGCGNFWFETAVGAPIDSQTAMTPPFAHNLGDEFGEYAPVHLRLNEIFYLGFWFDVDEDTVPSDTVDIYGWASLLWDGTELTLVDSAAETTGVGIYAGTYDAIPEPTSAGLLLAGIAAALLRCRPRRRSRIGGDG